MDTHIRHTVAASLEETKKNAKEIIKNNTLYIFHLGMSVVVVVVVVVVLIPRVIARLILLPGLFGQPFSSKAVNNILTLTVKL
jgi:uncharacterized membrane protein YkgB